MSKHDATANVDEEQFADLSDRDVTDPTFQDSKDESDVDAQVLTVLKENKGLYLTAQIVEAVTDYSEGYVRDHLHALADSDETDVVRERREKEIYGILVNGNFVVLTDDKDQLLDIVKNYNPSKFGEAKAMSNDELRSFIIDEVADHEVTSTTDKLYFGIPA